jgi:hypothetical protein
MVNNVKNVLGISLVSLIQNSKMMRLDQHEKIDCHCYGKRQLLKTKITNGSKHTFKGPHEKELCEACQSGHCDQVST